MTARSARRWARLALPAVLVTIASACAKNAPQDALDPAGPIARQQDNLFRPVFWIAAVIFFLVEGLIVFAAIKFRDRPGRAEPKQIHGNSRLEFTWTLIPAVILAGVAIPTVATILDLSDAPESGALNVTVIGHQWWWEYQYTDADPEVFTANELVIPTGREVFLKLESVDVIHSFWVPRLAGKQDVVPGRTNTMKIEADEPGTYLGQCAEFCAVSHANMRLRVVSMTPADFDSWLRDQQQPARAVIPGSPDARARDLFAANKCIECHTIRGVEGALGRQGPELTHFASRKTFAGSIFPIDEENLVRWIRDARERKQGVIMPPFLNLSDEELRVLARWLLSLE